MFRNELQFANRAWETIGKCKVCYVQSEPVKYIEQTEELREYMRQSIAVYSQKLIDLRVKLATAGIVTED